MPIPSSTRTRRGGPDAAGGQDVRHGRILADRTSLEVFVNDGAITMAFLTPVPDAGEVSVEARRGDAVVETLEISEVSSVWTNEGSAKKGS